MAPTGGQIIVVRRVAFQFDAAGFAVGIQRHSLAIDPAIVDGIVGLDNARLVHKRPVHRGDGGLGLLLGGEAQSAGHPLVSKYFTSP